MGRYFNRFDSDNSSALAEARYGAIERLALLAVEHSCDAVLVAGDVFDAQTVSDVCIRRTFNATAGFKGPWVMLPGNHDAALAESVWTRAQRIDAVPDNVHLALQSGVVELPMQKIAVLAAPLTQRHTYDDLTAPFDSFSTPPDWLRVGLAHGSVQGVLAEDIDATNPIAADRCVRAALDYLALGDWHGLKQINQRTWYSGTPEPERFRNNQPGFALLVTVSEPGALPQVEALETARYQWHQWQEKLVVETDIDELLKRLDELPVNSVLDLKLEGSITLAGEQRLANALSRAEARFRSVTCERSRLLLVPTEDDLAGLQAQGYVGDVIKQLQSRQTGAEAETARDALAILANLLLDAGTEERS
jgi:DNA repair exonuclease SbcCD nuclease subunit